MEVSVVYYEFSETLLAEFILLCQSVNQPAKLSLIVGGILCVIIHDWFNSHSKNNENSLNQYCCL